MSENKNVGDVNPKEVPEETKAEVVSRKAYEEVTRDMHKNKQKAKELEMKLSEYEAQLKAQEEAKLHEQQQYKELFEKRDAELEQARQEAQKERSRFTRSVKMAALKQELGGKVKDQYLSFANLDAITVNEDGSIDSESLRNVANDFRNQHAQLIPTDSSANVTGHAPGSVEPPQKVDITKMSREQLLERAKQLKN